MTPMVRATHVVRGLGPEDHRGVRPAIVIAIAASLGLAACGGGGGPPDGAHVGMDGGLDGGSADDGGGLVDGPPSDALDCVSGEMTEGCACESSGVTVCRGAGGIQCCHGAWQTFLDGPCWRVDAGGAAPACDAGPEPGCACAVADEIACRAFYQWRLVCRDGVWTEDLGHVCC
jgi:hypothetical protein